MSAFPNWQQYAIVQRRPETGCIPTGYEMILRAAGAQNIDFATFQDDFDLDKNRQPHEPFRNNFVSVADAVRARYPNVVFAERSFVKGSGAEKLKFVEQHLAKKQPLLISLANAAFGGSGWHIMPAVDMNQDTLILLMELKANGMAQLLQLPKPLLVSIHDTFEGGWEVAYLERC